MTSPDQSLAERITLKLAENKLIADTKFEKFKDDYSKGTISMEEWVLLAELDCKEMKSHD